MKRAIWIAMTVFFGLSLLLAQRVNANEEGLYPDAAPPGSAFVRFLNASEKSAIPVEVDGKSYGAATLGRISAYAPLPQGDTRISMGTQSVSLQLKEKAYYTAALFKGRLSILPEPANDNKLKAQIILINVSSLPGVSLKTADGITSIVGPVSPGTLSARSVNAVKAAFAVYSAARKVWDTAARSLVRENRYAIVVYDLAAGKQAVAVN
jgi:alginate O-acetyltransferase complex protein AlgF